MQTHNRVSENNPDENINKKKKPAIEHYREKKILKFLATSTLAIQYYLR